MRSLISATQLLKNTSDISGINALLSELHFPPLTELTPPTRQKLTLPPYITSASISRGTGALRALHIHLTPNTNPQEALTTIAKLLTHHAPHLLWLITATQQNSPLLAIATFAPTSPPRLAALITQRTNIVDSDAETFCALADTPQTNDILQHSRYFDTLGRHSITKRFYSAIEHEINTLAHSLTTTPPPAARTLAILTTSRLLFLAFLQTKGWLNNDHQFLLNTLADTIAANTNYHKNLLTPLFFGTLNTRPTKRATRAHAFGKIPFLNGGLFTRTPLERQYRHATFSNDAFDTLYANVFSRYRFTAREDSSTWSQSAIDPEMLGKVFESLMAPPERKRSGAFYTPQSIVEHVTTAALTQSLQTQHIPHAVVTQSLNNEKISNHHRGLLLDRINELTILDPACGSGAFLVHSLEQLAALRHQLGDPRPIWAIRQALLVSAIHGVDINPTAVWMCELRLWLSVVIDNPEQNPLRVLPLPNLDHNIRVGDSLTGGDFNTPLHITRKNAQLHHRYTRANGQRKRTLAKQLDQAERTLTLAYIDHQITTTTHQRKELITNARTPTLFAKRSTLTPTTRTKLTSLRTQLRRLRTTRSAVSTGAALPFAFATHFPTVARATGFTTIIGNPPWVRLHHIPPNLRTTLRDNYVTFKNAAWKAGAKHARATTGFAAQADASALFIERATKLLTPNGTLALLVPAKLWRALAGGGIRHFLATNTDVTTLEDLSDAPPAFDAATYPSIIAATKREHIHNTTTISPTTTSFAVHRPNTINRWTTSFHTLPLTRTPDSPWLIIPPHVRTAFNTLRTQALPVTRLAHPTLGVKSGCNHAFLVTELANNGSTATITSNTRIAEIESTSLRPILRGESVQPWTLRNTDERIIWTHDNQSAPHKSLPPKTKEWLQHWEHDLRNRSDVKHNTKWWTLFRTHAANTTHPRVVWSDFGKRPRAAPIPANDPIVPINTCYVIPCPTLDDAHALTTLLNSPILAAWLNTIAEPARGGYHRYLAWTVALLPISTNWARARAILAPLATQAIRDAPPTESHLIDATLNAFNLTLKDVHPLLKWHSP